MNHHTENESDRHPLTGSIPLWMSGRRPSVFPSLSEDEEADVCIVGAGITGLTLAYLLSATHRVIVLEKDFVGAGDTGRSSAHVTRVLDSDYGALAKRFGEDGARTAALAHGAAIDLIERIVSEESIACDFTRLDGYVVGEPGEDEKKLEGMRAGAARAGIDDTTLESQAPFEARRAGPCLRFPRQASFDPWRYVNGLAEAVKRRGGVIRTHTPVVQWSKGPPARVETARGPLVHASAVVLATHAPLGGRPGIHARLEAYRTYVIAGVLPRDAAPLALAWDTGSPYHYVRTAPRDENDVSLIVGGEDHRTGSGDESAERYARLERWARERFPSLGAIEHCWSGQVFEPAGGLGFAGPAGEKAKELYATGHSGNGLTHGTLSAILLSSLVREGAHDWTSVFDPGRLKLDDAVEVAKQGSATVTGLAERLKGEELESSDQVRPGEAAIVGKGSSRLAVYREPDGKLWECSALCSHMGCVVHWNGAERSWDCPCHGSRFDVSGRVLEGPATKDLTPADRVHSR